MPKSSAWLALGKADQALKRSQMQDRLQAQKEVRWPALGAAYLAAVLRGRRKASRAGNAAPVQLA